MIDIRQLTIGSHVSVDSKRVRVFGIGGNTIAYLQSIVSSICKGAETEDAEPIAVTPELLEELGFEKYITKYNTTTYQKKSTVDGYEIHFQKYNIGLREGWGVYLFKIIEDSSIRHFGHTHIRHLHEAEAFLALHGVELIPD